MKTVKIHPIRIKKPKTSLDNYGNNEISSTMFKMELSPIYNYHDETVVEHVRWSNSKCS